MNLARTIVLRLLNVIPLLLFLPLVTFVLMHFMPGSYFDTLRMNPQISQEVISKYESMYHLDKPVLVQYFYWLRNLLHFDFGYSFAYKQPVLTVLSGRLFNTLLLSTVSFFVAWLLGVFFGLLAGMRPNGRLSRGLGFFSYCGLSVPGFFLCLMFLWFVSQGLPLPLGGMKSVHFEELSLAGKILDVASHMVVPVLALSIGSFAFLFRFMRAQTQEVANRDFVLFLRACRMKEGNIIFKHVGRNAINPLISLFGLELPALFSGAALIEIITGWPGLGQMMLQAARTQDIFLVLGNMVMIAVLLVAGNLLADILLVLMDPRIRFQGRTV